MKHNMKHNVKINTDIDGVIKQLLSMRNLGYIEGDDNLVFSMIQGEKTGMDVNLKGVINRMKVSNTVAVVNGNIDQTARDWLGENIKTFIDKDKLFEKILNNSEVKPDYLPETYTFSSLSDPDIEDVFKNNDNLWWVKSTGGAGQVGQALMSSYEEVLKHEEKFKESSLFSRGFNAFTSWQVQKHVKSGIDLEHFLRVPFVIINDKVEKELSVYIVQDYRITPPPSGIQKYYKQHSLNILSYTKHTNGDCSTKNYITKKYGKNKWNKLQNNIKAMFKDIFSKVETHKFKTSATKYCFQLGCADIIIGKDFKPKFLEFGLSCGGFPFPGGRHPISHFSYGCLFEYRDDILFKFIDAILEKTLDKVNKPKNYNHLYKFTDKDLIIKYNYGKKITFKKIKNSLKRLTRKKRNKTKRNKRNKRKRNKTKKQLKKL